MKMEPKTTIAGLGVIGAATAGILMLAGLPFIEFEPPSPQSDVDDGYLLCLKSEAPFFKDVSARCYARSELLKLADAPVTDNTGAPVSVTLSHPTDDTAEDVIGRTCGVYFDLKRDGWFALTSRDQRREAYFIRACGALALMMEAAPAEVSHFVDESLSTLDIVEFLKGTPVGLAPLASNEENNSAELALTDEKSALTDNIAKSLNKAGENDNERVEPSLEREENGQWRVVGDDQMVSIQELALADFDGDDIAEMLVFIRSGPADGTAVIYAIGLLEKDSADAQLSFQPSDYASS